MWFHLGYLFHVIDMDPEFKGFKKMEKEKTKKSPNDDKLTYGRMVGRSDGRTNGLTDG